ncbi:phosphoserine phosphatase SerB [Pseudoalteromonas rubra]|uniref:Phosphoserine phosphatase n=1 Tax=Pseudoalteromonas rubra TaxID=43658 RepID=A0A5S3WMK5_9GAMM|nr:phosphoserine phosphatase SerB [Pseudoalteromonas rubra]TMP29332.1 phosphoserine phosphatase SerB [Pseudoalteromonas rubra]TMP34063.1 phosphoserine phosphatase SerB [Pseudoalteromonas rubra]
MSKSLASIQLRAIAEPAQQLLTLAKWYQIENEDHLKPGACPLSEGGQYLCFFGDELSEETVLEILGLCQRADIEVTRLALYQPTADMVPGLVLYTQSTRDVRTAIRTLAAQCGLQGAAISQPPSLRKPGLLVMDMDSTAIKIECIDEIARLAGVYDEVAAVTAQAMAGQLAFNDSLHQRVAKLSGVELPLIQQLKDNLPLMEGVAQLCAVLKAHHWHLAIASGGFTWFAEALKAPLQLDAVFANTLEIADDKLTGKVLGEVVDGSKKAEVLKSLAEQFDISANQTVAMGDGANDLIMMAAAGLGVAVHGKPKVVEQADAAITQGSLTQLLYLLSVPV